MRSKKVRFFYILLILAFLSSCRVREFNGEIALSTIETQIAFGPRIPGSEATGNFIEFLTNELSSSGLSVEQQSFLYRNTPLTNVIAKTTTSPPEIIIGTHFDTRAISDRDPDPSKRATPVPGANDGASGTAILLELAAKISGHEKSIWLVFFDGEDQGGINEWDWSAGAQYFANQLTIFPEEVIIIDMVGDSDLNIYYEANSSKTERNRIWEIANQLGYNDNFISEEKYSVMDDHIPFINLGIPSVLIIDLDYEKWHTSEDNIDHVSEKSLGIVGEVLLEYLSQK